MMPQLENHHRVLSFIVHDWCICESSTPRRLCLPVQKRQLLSEQQYSCIPWLVLGRAMLGVLCPAKGDGCVPYQEKDVESLLYVCETLHSVALPQCFTIL